MILVFGSAPVQCPAQAHFEPPPGWLLETSEQGFIMSAPCGGGLRSVVYAILPSERLGEKSTADWFNGKVGALSADWTGKHVDALGTEAGIRDEAALFAERIEFLSGDGTARAAMLLGYATAGVGQLYIVIANSDLDEDDATLQAALDHARDLAARRFVLDPAHLKQTRLHAPASQSGAAPVAHVLAIRAVHPPLDGRVGGTPRTYALSRSGRVFDGTAGDAPEQGSWLRTEAGFELIFNDGRRAHVPETCLRSAAITTAGDAPGNAPAGGPSQTNKTCRTVTRPWIEIRLEPHCTPPTGCVQRPVETATTYQVTVCD